MSADDKGAVCPAGCVEPARTDETHNPTVEEICDKKNKPKRKVCFPDDEHIVTQYFEPAKPWQDVPPTSRTQLAAEYSEWCRRHDTTPLDCVLQQIRELPESCIGGATRAPRLTLASAAPLLGPAPADALEALFKRAQFRRLELQAPMDDAAAEALFDMVEYYESATAISLSGPRLFGIRGWQAASRMIKRSSQLQELEISDHPLEASHAPVLARALHTHSCQLRTLCLQRVLLGGDSLLCLVIALKSNSSVRELRLADNRLTCADALQIASLLRYNTRLQLLDLSNNMIQDAGAGHIAEALADQSQMGSPSSNASPLSPLHCPVRSYEARGLSFLVLWNNQLTRNCAHHISKALMSQSLCVLNVGRNAVGAELVRAVTSGGGGALLSLGLQSARLTADSARALHDLVRADTRLQRLDLRDNKLGGAGLQAILTAMRDNKTLTQIDLDEPHESPTLTTESSEAATVVRLTREIRALCRGNEQEPSPERRAHRKISLTCYSAAQVATRSGVVVEEERRARLRSPLPSPAGSPVPPPPAHGTPSRFSVSRVTPERQPCSVPTTATPTRTTHSPTSRFRVVQVAEPPTIHVHTPEPTRKSNRFSVTRNTDSSYNVTPVPSPPPTAGINPSGGTPAFDIDSTIGKTPPKIKDMTVETDEEFEEMGNVTSGPVSSDLSESTDKGSEVKQTDTSDKDDKNNKTVDVKISEIDSNVEISENANVNNVTVNIGSNDREIDKSCVNSNADTQSKRDDMHHEKTKQLAHSKVDNILGNKTVLKSESNLETNSTGSSETNKRDAEDQVTVKTETVDIEKSEKPTKIHDDRNVTEFQNIDDVSLNSDKEDSDVEVIISTDSELVEKRSVRAAKHIEALTEDLGLLIEDMKELSTKSSCIMRKDVKSGDTQTETHIKTLHSDDGYVTESTNVVRGNVSVILKKNKSESSLGSPDLEVSRLMSKKVSCSPFCDSSSSLEISGSSLESLSAIDHSTNPNLNIRVSNIHILPKPIVVEEPDTELDRRTIDQIMSTTESSIESNTCDVQTVNAANFLNMSVSSNESVSPIIFSAKKIHGSLSSLEASVSSLDSARQDRVMVTSTDSGIEYSIQNPTEKEDELSNEGTLTLNSNLKESGKAVDSFLQDTLTCSPKRTSSLLDVPALNKGLDRMRKISWVAPSSSFHIPKPEPEKETKLPSNLEKLMSLFQHPTSLFSRSSQSDDDKKCNTPPRKDSSLTSSFWSWGSSSEKEKDTTEVADSASTETNPFVTQVTTITKDVSAVVTKVVLKDGDPYLEVQKQSGSTTSSLKVSQRITEIPDKSDISLEPSKSPSQSTQITEVSQSSSLTHFSLKDSKTSDSSDTTQVTFSLPGDDSWSTDSTLSERAQIAFVDESFSKKFDSKTSSTDTENTLSEYQSAQLSFDSISQDKCNDCAHNQSKAIDASKEICGTSECLKCEKNIVTDGKTTDCNTVQSLDLSDSCDSSNGDQPVDNPRACDTTDLSKPNDNNMSKNYDIDNCESKDFTEHTTRKLENVPSIENVVNVNPEDEIHHEALNETKALVENTTRSVETSFQTSVEQRSKHKSQENPEAICKASNTVLLPSEKTEETKEHVRPRSFAAVLKASASENTLEKPSNPDGEPVDKLPSKVIKGIKENISPENTLTASMTNTKTLTLELEKVRNQPIANVVWEMCGPSVDLDKCLDGKEACVDIAGCYKDSKVKDDIESCIQTERPLKAPIATIDEACEYLPSQFDDVKLPYVDDLTFIDEKTSEDVEHLDRTREGTDFNKKVVSLESVKRNRNKDESKVEMESVDVAKDALSYLIYENQDFDPENEATVSELKTDESSLAQELKDAEDKEKLIDLSPELIIEDTEDPEVFSKEFIALRASPVIPDRAKLKKASSLEDILSEKASISPKTKTIAFKIPETSPRDIPVRPKLRSRSGTSPKSLPESLNKCPLTKLDTKKNKKVSSLGKMAKDSLLALNMTEEEIAEFRRSYKLTSVESLRSLESVSEDANSQSGTSFDSRCRSCLRTSQESLMSLDSITEDCRCSEQDKLDKLSRSTR